MGMVIPGSVLAASMARDSIMSGKMDLRDPIRRKEELPGQGPGWGRDRGGAESLASRLARKGLGAAGHDCWRRVASSPQPMSLLAPCLFASSECPSALRP